MSRARWAGKGSEEGGVGWEGGVGEGTGGRLGER